MLCGNGESSFIVLRDRQPKSDEDIDTHKNIPFLQTGSTVAVEMEDGRPWTHGTIIGHGSDDHNGIS